MDRDIGSCRACHGGRGSYVEIFEAISFIMEQPNFGFISKIHAVVVGNLFMLHRCNYIDEAVTVSPTSALRNSRLNI